MLVAGLMVGGTFAFAAGHVLDLTTAGATASANGALFAQTTFGGSTGTGVFDTFVTIGNNGTEQGFNTDARPIQTGMHTGNSATHNRSLRLDTVPEFIVSSIPYREFRLDINQVSGATSGLLSMENLRIFTSSSTTLNGFNPATNTFATGGLANLVWDLDGDGDRWVKMNYNLAPGSGNGDIRVLIPSSVFGPGCAYDAGTGGADCGTYVYLYSSFGENHASNDGFEEWSVRKVPYAVKTADTSYTRTFPWTIEKSASPDTWDLNTGDSGTSEYNVSVVKGDPIDSDLTVSGTITIINPASGGSPRSTAASITNVTDALPGGSATVTCPSSFPIALAGGGTVQCTYTGTVASNAPGTNTATVTYSTASLPTNQIEAKKDFAFGAPTTVVNGTINVTDSVQGALGSASDDQTFTYTDTFTCDDDVGDNDNTATIVETSQTADATVTVNCYTPTVTKTAVERLTRTYLWTIDKSVSPDTWDLNTGDSGTSAYEVTVDKTGSEDSGWTVEGEITISNPNPSTPLDITDVTDEINPGAVAATVSCPSDTVAAGGSITCDYGPVDVTDGSDRTNTATATYQNYSYDEDLVATEDGTSDVTGDADVDFSEAVVSEVNGTINVSDSVQGDLGSASDDYTFEYTDTFTCDDDEGENDNTAEIVETGQTADASVTVNCYTPTVEKTAVESLTRTWTWTIDKVGDQTELTLMPGQVFIVNYDVEVDATSADSEWAVEGEITINNPNLSSALDITAIVDEIDPGDFGATVDCGGATSVPADDSLTCDYGPVGLPNADNRTNTATVTYQNYSYDELGAPTANGTSDVTGEADVDFSEATVNHVDEEITVTDDNATPGDTSDDTVLGTANALTDTLPKTFEFSYELGPYTEADCGEFEVVNVASFEANDTDQAGDNDHVIVVTIPCPEGCTLTQGYWKTHNETFPGGAPADDTWLLIAPSAELSPFFLSGDTWFGVFWTPPQGGNVYYQLAHQYMAAKLNILNGASAPTSVTNAISAAEAWFVVTTPAQAAELKGKAAKDLRALASTLASYNEGLIGPGHCDEDSTSNLTLALIPALGLLGVGIQRGRHRRRKVR